MTDRSISVTSCCILKHSHESLFYPLGDLIAGNIPPAITSMQLHKFHTLGREEKGSGRGGSELSLITLPYTSNVSSLLLRVYISITVICIYVQNFPEHIKLGHFITIIIGCALYKRYGLTTSFCYPRHMCVIKQAYPADI